MNADERRFIARAYIAHVRLVLSAAPCKNQGLHRKARRVRKEKAARGEGRMGGGGARERGGGGA